MTGAGAIVVINNMRRGDFDVSLFVFFMAGIIVAACLFWVIVFIIHRRKP